MEGLHGLKTYADPPPLGFSTRTRAGRVPVAQDECWANLQKPGSGIVSSLSPLPHRATMQGNGLPHPGDHLKFHLMHFTGPLFYNRPC